MMENPTKWPRRYPIPLPASPLKGEENNKLAAILALPRVLAK
jgi:hypothetical protein